MANYYGCEGKHSEINCLSASYHDKRYRFRTAWCEPCLARFPHVDEEE